MSDHPTPTDGDGDGDGDERDLTLAAMLAVPPLDDGTRRRLVQGALLEADAGNARRSRVMAAASVAAAILLGVLAGVVLVDRPDAPTTTAAPAPAVAAPGGGTAFEPANPAGGTDGEALRSVGVPFAPLGDAGNVSDPEQLRRRLDSLLTRGAKASDSARTTEYACAGSQPEAFGLVAITAAATGTYHGEPVTVIVGTAPPDGSERAVVVRPATCAILVSVTLTTS